MTFPSEEQRRYLGSSIDDNVYLEACPGSGKTEVIAAKVAREIEDWQGYPGGSRCCHLPTAPPMS